ncbi:MAG: type II toxin-antitoxin system RatA family toxin [Proteobacteria bacterium]|nr:type II toxin-antitoxin system RatA family toxin [Pseudomonadota bacterium]MDA0896808.1 type II toxin-antitoxin system RatA family toxin [Pseudomonadota bacterium]MDA1244819.1 type II toxin-antitoxin system RatA family toxin [Pseudomonadota bacterium]
MAHVSRSALIGYSAQQMFDLVNDIEQYPQFMQGCRSARVISKTDTELVGELSLAKAGVTQTFVTRNSLIAPSRIEMRLEEGNFSKFSADWQFQALTEAACKVSFDMEFEFKYGLVDLAVGKLVSSSANNLVDALVDRAKLVYG